MFFPSILNPRPESFKVSTARLLLPLLLLRCIVNVVLTGEESILNPDRNYMVRNLPAPCRRVFSFFIQQSKNRLYSSKATAAAAAAEGIEWGEGKRGRKDFWVC